VGERNNASDDFYLCIQWPTTLYLIHAPKINFWSTFFWDITQPFPLNTIEPTCKEVLVQPEVTDKGKGENIVISDPRTSNISQEEIARKAPDKETSKSRGARGQTQLRIQARQPDPSIADGLVLRQTVRLTQPDSPPMARGVSVHTKLGKRRQRPHGWLVKAGLTFDQLLAKYAGKKAVLCDRPRKKPRSPTKTK
jgi:hypothetical protein